MILILSTLASLPIYSMSLFPIPRSVRMRIERIQRNFLWGGGALERRPHLVNWEVVCRDKKSGGPGIKKLSILNKALFCKWSWRFMQKIDALWNILIRVKYGEDQGGWCTKMVRAGYGVGVWKVIRKGWDLVAGKIVFEVGNGSRVVFWKDKWCGSMTLCDAFPNLFVVAAHKDAVIKEIWSPDEGGGCWNPLFVRPFNDWELEEVNNFLTCLNRTKVQPSLEDKVRWVEEKNGLFSVNSMFKVLDSASHGYFLVNIIWRPKIQSRICFFAWEAAWGKASTLDQIKKRGRSLANRCFLCKGKEETIDHLLLHYGVTRVLWGIFSFFGVHWVFLVMSYKIWKAGGGLS